MHQVNKYPISLYLNQKYVFDILAMMEGGFSQLETIKTTQSSQDERSRKFSGEIGVKNVFAFLGISLGGEHSKKDQASESQELFRERVHTPNSLFAKLRERLHDECLIASTDLSNISSGSFVEFRIMLRKNPLIETFESLKTLMTTALIFEDTKTKPKGGKPLQDPNQRILDQFNSFLSQLSAEGTIDLIGATTDNNKMKAVITMETAFLNDLSMSDLVEGEYMILGKVTKVIAEGSNDKINLLRKTSLGKLQNQILDDLMKHLKDIQGLGIKLPELITEIEGPAIQVIPIAVFA